MGHLQRQIGEWAAATFPDQTDERIVNHLREEVGELGDAVEGSWLVMLPQSAAIRDEAADCAILLLCLAERHGFDLLAAAADKMAINRTRTYAHDPEKGYDTRVEATS